MPDYFGHMAFYLSGQSWLAQSQLFLQAFTGPSSGTPSQ